MQAYSPIIMRICLLVPSDPLFHQVLSGDDCGWRLMSINDSKTQGWAPHFCVKYLQSAGFYLLIMTAIIGDAIWAASLVFRHDGTEREEIYRVYYYAEVCFTIFFDLEAIVKLWCLGFNGYFRLTIHKFEFVLAVGTTIRLIPPLFMTALTYFQVSVIGELIGHISGYFRIPFQGLAV